MNKKSKKIILLSLVICLCVVGSATLGPKLWASNSSDKQQTEQSSSKTTAQAETSGAKVTDFQQSAIKNETVYAKLSSEGKVQDTTVVNWYHFAGTVPESFTDPAKLKDAQALNGAFSATSGEDGVVIAGIDTKQKDLYYSGSTQQALPVNVGIDYYLNGKKLPAEQITGKSGKVEMKISLKNKLGSGSQGATGNGIYTPLLAMISVDLPADKYSNVDAGDGMVTVVGETMKVNWISFPYPDSTVVLSTDVQNFKLDPINIIVQPQMPTLPQIEMEEDLVKMSDGVNQLDAALEKIQSGSQSLVSGQEQIGQGLDKTKQGLGMLVLLNQGEQKILQGALFINDSLLQGLDQYKSNAMVSPVIDALSKQNSLLKTALQGGELEGQSVPPMSAGADGLMQAQQALGKLQAGTEQSREGAQQIYEGVSRVRSEGVKPMQQGVDSSLQKVRDGKEQIEIMKSRVEQYDSFMGKPAGTEGKVQFVLQTETL